MRYPATIIPRQDGSGRYTARFADLPGCLGSGANPQAALQSAARALARRLEELRQQGLRPPAPSSLEEAWAADEARAAAGNQLPPGTFWEYVTARTELSKP